MSLMDHTVSSYPVFIYMRGGNTGGGYYGRKLQKGTAGEKLKETEKGEREGGGKWREREGK